MVRVVQAMGVGEVGVLHAQLLGLGVHPLHKGLGAARNCLGQDVTGLVGGGEQVAVEQLLHSEDLPSLNGGIGVGAALGQGYRLLGGGNLIIQAELASLNGLQHHQGGHDLGDGGGVNALIAVLLIEYLAVVAVYQDGRVAVGLGIIQGHGRDGEGQGQGRSQQQ